MPRRTSLIAALALTVITGTASAAMLTVTEDAIQSLASAPELIEAVASVNEVGRPALALTLRFTNDCYADRGVRVLVARRDGAAPYAIVTQAVSDEACIEIFQPTERKVTALLPSRFVSTEIRLIGKPAPGGLVRSVPVTQGNATAEGAVVEAAELKGGQMPALAVSRLDIGSRGYTIAGQATVPSGCPREKIAVSLFEVPNAVGTPIYDALFVTAPASCSGSGETIDVTIAVNTPQSHAGRSIYVTNEPTATARPLYP